MKKLLALGVTTALILGTFAAPAQAEWRGHGGGGYHGGHGEWRGGRDRGYYGGGGGWVGPTVLGLGAAAIIGGVIASQSAPPVYYAAPPPVYYAPPAPPAQPGYWASDGRFYYGTPPVYCGYPRC